LLSPEDLLKWVKKWEGKVDPMIRLWTFGECVDGHNLKELAPSLMGLAIIWTLVTSNIGSKILYLK
jgi:hypothetical protein